MKVLEILDKSNRITKVYMEELYKKCYELAKKISEALEDVIKEIAMYDSNLFISNSVYKNKTLFYITNRVKDENSFKEKLIRKNYLVLFDELNEEGIKSKILERINDLIGIKILTNLNKGTISIANLLPNIENKLKEKHIYLKNINKPFQKCANGRDNLRIDGYIEDSDLRYPFELQATSQANSAWAELEHFLFYKDFSYKYSKAINNEIMNKIGITIDCLDDLMYEVKKTVDMYDSNSLEEANLKDTLYKYFEPLYTKYFSDDYYMKQNLDFLVFIIRKYKLTGKLEFMKKEKIRLNDKNYDVDVSDDMSLLSKYLAYNKLVGKNFDKMISDLVAYYVTTYNEKYGTHISEKNYVDNFNLFIELLDIDFSKIDFNATKFTKAIAVSMMTSNYEIKCEFRKCSTNRVISRENIDISILYGLERFVLKDKTLLLPFVDEEQKNNIYKEFIKIINEACLNASDTNKEIYSLVKEEIVQ